jgi:hypothetical protein
MYANDDWRLLIPLVIILIIGIGVGYAMAI